MNNNELFYAFGFLSFLRVVFTPRDKNKFFSSRFIENVRYLAVYQSGTITGLRPPSVQQSTRNKSQNH